MALKNKDNIRNKDNLKNEDILKNEGNKKRAQPQQHYLKKLLLTPQLDRHSKTDPKPEMLSAV